MIIVMLMHGTQMLPVAALIDTGSTESYLPLRIARRLGLDLTGKKGRARGGGGDFQYVPAILEECHLMDERNAAFATLTGMQVCVADVPHMILGRDYIFRKFRITFDEVLETMTLESRE